MGIVGKDIIAMDDTPADTSPLANGRKRDHQNIEAWWCPDVEVGSNRGQRPMSQNPLRWPRRMTPYDMMRTRLNSTGLDNQTLTF